MNCCESCPVHGLDVKVAVDAVMTAVAREVGVDKRDIMNKRLRYSEMAEARGMVITRLHRDLGWDIPRIARRLKLHNATIRFHLGLTKHPPKRYRIKEGQTHANDAAGRTND